MPTTGTHLALAERIEAEGRRRKISALAFSTARSRLAYYAGTMAPDSGAFPGGNWFLAQLTHYVSTGALARALFTRARDETQRAFAAGWLTHLVADVTVHPIINRAVAEIEGKGRGASVPYELAPKDHMRVELGLEAGILPAYMPSLEHFPNFILDEAESRFIADAFSDTYGITLTPQTLQSAHRTTAKYADMLYQLARITAARFKGSLPPRSALRIFGTSYLAIRAGALLYGERSAWYGIAAAAKPGEEFMAEAARALETCMHRSCDLLEGNLDGLEDYNLDTGETLPTPAYRSCEEALRALDKARAAGAPI
jgi:hypothetical protein